jgi:hypothetical protein
MHISTIRAASRPSLQVRGGSASTARADIQIAKELSFFLHRRKAAPSPFCEFDFLAESACYTENAAIAKSSAPPRGGKPAIHASRCMTNPANSQPPDQADLQCDVY